MDPRDDAPPLATRLDFLRARCAAPQVRETHMSWLLFGPDRVFKLKKPVRTDALDFSTPALRERDAREELRLNRRLAPGVYLGLLALQWDGAALDLVPEEAARPERTVDWLVAMRRLPAERMLDRMVLDGCVTPDHVDALARRLSAFYREAARPPVAPAAHLARLRHEQAVNRRVLATPALGLAAATEGVLAAFDRALAAGEGALAARVRRGCLVDGHGDLRPEHVCLVEPPLVIDALEFDAGLRLVDPFDELGFLGLECEMVGGAWIGPRLVARCAQALGDHPPPALLALWRAYRALVRARLSLAHLLDAAPRAPERWRPAAQRYLACAGEALGGLRT